MGSVLHNWVMELPWKMQSVLIASSRGPDTDKCPRIKGISRWIRQVTQRNADPKTQYMMLSNLGNFDEELKLEIGFCTLHFFSHFLHGLEIIAYKHPFPEIAHQGLYFYISLADYLHLEVEPKQKLNERLGRIIDETNSI